MLTYSDPGFLVGGLLLAYAGVVFASGIVAYVIGSFFFMRLFERAGVQGQWRAWIPVYNTVIFAKLGDVSPWVVLGIIGAGIVFSIIPFLGFLSGLVGLALLVALALAGWRVGMKSGRREWFWLLLWLIPGVGMLIWLGLVAFDKGPWNPNIGPTPWAQTILADPTRWDGIPVQPAQAAGGVAPGPAGPASYGAPTGAGYAPPPSPSQPSPGYPSPGAPGAGSPGFAPPPPSGATPGFTPPPPGFTPPPATGGTPPPPPATGDTPPPPAGPVPDHPDAPRP